MKNLSQAPQEFLSQKRIAVVGVSRTGSENYLKALSCYPARFARDPELSFEQHLCSFVYALPARTGMERRRS